MTCEAVCKELKFKTNTSVAAQKKKKFRKGRKYTLATASIDEGSDPEHYGNMGSEDSKMHPWPVATIG